MCLPSHHSNATISRPTSSLPTLVLLKEARHLPKKLWRDSCLIIRHSLNKAVEISDVILDLLNIQVHPDRGIKLKAQIESRCHLLCNQDHYSSLNRSAYSSQKNSPNILHSYLTYLIFQGTSEVLFCALCTIIFFYIVYIFCSCAVPVDFRKSICLHFYFLELTFTHVFFFMEKPTCLHITDLHSLRRHSCSVR